MKAWGNHHSATHRPRKSDSETGSPCWSGKVNSGAVVPSASMGVSLASGYRSRFSKMSNWRVMCMPTLSYNAVAPVSFVESTDSPTRP